MAGTLDRLPVSVLLSTFNGARYLQPQLDSVAMQACGDWSLMWRDDGSDDDTVSLMNRFATGSGRGRCIRVDPASSHLGIAGSFLRLLREVEPGHIAAFADQDDVWLSDKLARGRSALAAVPSDQPALYCARQRLVDDALEPLGLSPHPGRPTGFPAALTQNVATGCTVMLNPAAVALVAHADPPEGTLHDWWCYLVVSAAGGRLIADPVPVVLYRQHRDNAVGAPHSLLRRGLMALQRGPGSFMLLFRRHVAGLQRCRSLLSSAAQHDLDLLEHALRRGPLARFRAMARLHSLKRQTVLETVLFRIWFLLG